MYFACLTNAFIFVAINQQFDFNYKKIPMRKVVIILLLFGIAQLGYAQKSGEDLDWAAPGSQWSYDQFTNNVTIEAHSVPQLIQGKKCTIMSGPFAEDSLYTYEEENKVYVYNPIWATFEMVYDFDALPGDSWRINIDSCFSVTLTVQDTGFVDINGYRLHTQDYIIESYDFLSNEPIDSSVNFHVIEKIGATRMGPMYPFYDAYLTCTGYLIDWVGLGELYCFQSDQLGLYSRGTGSCDLVEGGDSLAYTPFILEEELNGRTMSSINLEQGRWVYNQGAIKDRYSKGDTLINGETYVKWYDRNHVDGAVYFGAVRQETGTQRYWIYPAEGAAEELLYDFEAPFDSTVQVYSATYGTVNAHIIGIEHITLLNNENRLQWRLAVYTPISNFYIGEMHWIEGIGLDRLTYMGGQEGQNYFYLCHYAENNQLLYNSGASCIAEPVFPGDANHDGVANALDLLPIGFNYNKIGSPRSSKHYTDLLAWEPQISIPWADSSSLAYNMKHIDTNGDGVINIMDKAAIQRNYDKMHEWFGKTSSSANFDLSFIVPEDVEPGEMVTVDVVLGSENNPVEGLYGIVFTVNYDTALVEPNTIMAGFTNSWFGEDSTNMITLYYDHPTSGELDIAIVRIDQQEAQGFGKVGQVHFVMDDDLLGKTKGGIHALSFSNIHAINLQEEWIEVKGEDNQIVIANEPLPLAQSELKLYPNPIGDQFFIQAKDQQIQLIEIYNSKGQLVLTQKADQVTLLEVKTSALPKGIYITRCYTQEGLITRKIIK